MVETFGDRLQQALIDKGWKQIDLANATGFSKARISQWVHNKYIPNAEGLNRIAESLGVSETWLMGHNTPKTYDRKTLEMQYEICDLFQKCYGKDAYNAVSLFLKLDDYDKDVVMKILDSLSSNEKYSAKKESQNA
ncbi:MAG: helix-turn-helix domain-containing protein [Lachnospiraceae bacterium]